MPKLALLLLATAFTVVAASCSDKNYDCVSSSAFCLGGYVMQCADGTRCVTQPNEKTSPCVSGAAPSHKPSSDDQKPTPDYTPSPNHEPSDDDHKASSSEDDKASSSGDHKPTSDDHKPSSSDDDDNNPSSFDDHNPSSSNDNTPSPDHVSASSEDHKPSSPTHAPAPASGPEPDHVQACTGSETIPSYEIKGSSFEDVVKGNFVDEAYKMAQAYVLEQLAEDGSLGKECHTVDHPTPIHACYTSVRPGHRKSAQQLGQYGFQFEVQYTCPHDEEAQTLDCQVITLNTREHDWVHDPEWHCTPALH